MGVSGGRPARKANNLTADCLRNVEASMSHNFMGLNDLLLGQPYVFTLFFCKT
jgi:hypothetical protein